MSRTITGVKPSGLLHIGNYFGAVEPAFELQSAGQLLLFLADYHAITVPQDPQKIREQILFTAAVYLSAGFDLSKTILFQQSQVSEHTELGWILNCVAKVGELERMTQFKDKSKSKGENVSMGLFDYPVLMAADILLYDTSYVPVGEDQKQHIELARDLAIRFNKTYGETFVVPEPRIREVGAGGRIMGLDDPMKKMSKSATSPKNYISLLDDADTVMKKMKSAVTDSTVAVRFDPQEKPAISNLLTIYSLVSKTPIPVLEERYASATGYAGFKTDLAEQVIAWLTPIQTKMRATLADEESLIRLLEDGAKRARAIAKPRLELVKERLGLVLKKKA